MQGLSGVLQERSGVSKETADAAVGYLAGKFGVSKGNEEAHNDDFHGSVEVDEETLNVDSVPGAVDEEEASEQQDEERWEDEHEGGGSDDDDDDEEGQEEEEGGEAGGNAQASAKRTAPINPNNPERGKDCPGGKKKCRGDANMLWSTVLMKPSKQDIGNVWAPGSKGLPLDEGTVGFW